MVYHALSEPRAMDHFRALRARYHLISLADYLRVRSEGASERLPAKSLIITIDDGHASNFKLKQLLQELRVPVTIFLCSGIVGTHRHYWWFHTRSADETEACKRMPDAERLAFLAGRGYDDQREYPDRKALSRDEIDSLRALVDFQAHTVTHPIMPACSDEKAEREIRDSKVQLENEYDFNIQALAFPNGDYTEREIRLAREAGYRCALTLDSGFNDEGTDLFRLRRVAVPDEASVSELLVKASGLWIFFVA